MCQPPATSRGRPYNRLHVEACGRCAVRSRESGQRRGRVDHLSRGALQRARQVTTLHRLHHGVQRPQDLWPGEAATRLTAGGSQFLEVTVKPFLFALAALLAAPMQAQQPTLPPELPFESVPDHFKYPAEMNLGEMASVAVNSKGHVFMLSRSNVTGPLFGAIATQVLEFDQNGKYVREIGKGLYGFGYAHSIRFDKDDNMWVVDKGTNMIMKFNPEGHVTMVFGRKEEASDEHRYPSLGSPERPPQIDNYFNQPTDIAWDKDGNSYISDGYVNSRIAKIDKNGDWVKSWGVRGTEPGQFNTPHNIGVDNSGNI